jgi:hypothetical protein
MTVLVSPNDPRGPQAIALVLADEWKRFVDRGGRVSFSIPSSTSGRYYRATDDGCTCADQKYRPWGACKHVLAVRLHLELDQDQEAYAF